MNKEVLKAIADKLGMNSETIEGALTAEDFNIEELTLPNGDFYTEEQISSIREEVGKESARKGANTIVEMDLKELSKEYGFEQNAKSVKQLADMVKEQVSNELKAEPNEQISKYKGLIETLQGKLEALPAEYEEKISNMQSEIRRKDFESRHYGWMPGKLPESWERDELLTLYNSKFQPDFDEDGREIVKQLNGEVLRDNKTLRPITHEEAFKSFLDKKGITKIAGRNGNDERQSPKNDIKTAKEWEEYIISRGKNPRNSTHQGELLVEKRKENPEFRIPTE